MILHRSLLALLLPLGLVSCAGGAPSAFPSTTLAAGASMHPGTGATTSSEALFVASPTGMGFNADGEILGFSVPVSGGTPTLSTSLTIPSPGVPLINGFPAGIAGPNGIAVDGAGNLWIGDGYTDAIFAYTNPQLGPPKAIPTRLIAKPDGAQQNGIGAIGFDKRGNLWALLGPPASNPFATTSLHGFAVPAGSGAPTPIAGDSLSVTGGFAFDPAGNLWVANGLSSVQIVEYNIAGATPVATGHTIALTGGGDPSPAVTFDAAGHLWIVQSRSLPALTADLVQEFDPSTGALLARFSAQHSFLLPNAAFDPQGHLWISALSGSSTSSPNGLAEYAVPSGTPLATTTSGLGGATAGQIVFAP